jgi:hypothetical protein
VTIGEPLFVGWFTVTLPHCPSVPPEPVYCRPLLIVGPLEVTKKYGPVVS